MHKAVNGNAFALEIAEVLWIGGDFDGDELVGPDVMAGAPDLAKGPAADPGIQHIFPDTLTGLSHFYTFSASQSQTNRLYTPATRPPSKRKVQAAGPNMCQLNSQARRMTSARE